MIPVQLTLKNFLSYRDATLDFSGLHTPGQFGVKAAPSPKTTLSTLEPKMLGLIFPLLATSTTIESFVLAIEAKVVP